MAKKLYTQDELDELLREAELKGVKFSQYATISATSARIAELEKARAGEKGKV